MRLNECAVGTYAKVIDLLLGNSHRKRMLDLGLLPGTEVQVVRRAPLGGPMVIRFRGYQISFRLAEAKNIEIEAVQR